MSYFSTLVSWLRITAPAFVLLLFASLSQPLNAQDILQDEVTVEASDGRLLTYFVQRPLETAPVPLLLVIDGSGCLGAKRDGFAELMSPAGNPDLRYARLVVGKSGVPETQSDPDACTEEFLQNYSMQKRVLDHMRVLQSLRSNAQWWNGDLLIYEWSDGGDIAVRLFAYTPDATRLAFGGVGGGYTMQEHFERFWACPQDLGEAQSGCLEDLRRIFKDIRENPTWRKTWAGPSNSYLAWDSRLSTRLTPLLKDEWRDVLMVHGADDFEGAPVQSARKLADDLAALDNDTFTYWEVKGMSHDMWSLAPEMALQLERNTLIWLLKGQADLLPIIVER